MRSILAASILLVARGTSACSVCFGASENGRIPAAFLVGTVVLIGAVFCMLGGLAYAVYRIESSRKDDLVTADSPISERAS